MFSGFDSNKKREKSRKDPAIGIAGQDSSASTGPGAAATGQDPRDLGGVTIQEFSKSQKIAEPEAWRMLRRGELVGRTFEGRLYVFTNVEDATPDHIQHTHQNNLIDTINELMADEAEAELLGAAKFFATDSAGIETESWDSGSITTEAPTKTFEASALPPLPGTGQNFSARDFARTSSNSQNLPVASERIGSTEIALLLDHLSLAKEENREILKMTQESIRKVTELTDTIVEMKDSLLEARETQILFLKDQLDGREKEIRKLKQQKEDLEILAQTIMATQKPEKSRK